jgi:hypothetical protein
MKRKIYIFILLPILLYSCTPMDYKYSGFTDDGPITYIAKLKESEVKVIGERNRVHIIIPKQSDPRGTKIEIYWSNKREHHVETFDPSKETDFYINDLVEASYIFEITVLDNAGNSSIPVAVSATVYGNIWESYMPNRIITRNEKEGDGSRKISYEINRDNRLIGSDFEWKQDGASFTVQVDSSQTTGYLTDFKASSFRYRTRYIPEEGGEDVFYSPWEYYLENVNLPEEAFNKATTTFTLPTPNDGNWIGYEFLWADRISGELRSQTTNANTITLENYNALSVNYRTLYRFDDVEISSVERTYSTVRYVDLDRSTWFAAPETRISDGTPLNNNSEAQVADKNKSPYLSHLLFYAASGTDGQISPRSHFDNDQNTYLSMVKGYGTGLQNNRDKTGTQHSYGGVSSNGNDVYFVIDLGDRETFNYFRIVYRSAQANGNLKPQMVSFFGSNDPGCITDPDKWEVIEESIVPPGCNLASNSNDPNNPGRVTGNVVLPESSYRYLKLRYDAWTDASQSMAITEFYLGLYN